MDILDTPAAFARMEERFRAAAFPSAYPARICISHSVFAVRSIGRILRVVHEVRRSAVHRRVGI
jgi:hypothetical protein